MALPSFDEYWNEIEPSVLMVVGFVLLVFPEPATSTLGAGLLLFGIAWWFYEWDREPGEEAEAADETEAAPRARR